MEISVSQAQGNVPVTVIKIDGRLDGQNYQELVSKAQELLNAGACDFLLDLSDLTFISSSGLVALCSVAMLARGENISNAAERSPHPAPSCMPRSQAPRNTSNYSTHVLRSHTCSTSWGLEPCLMCS